MGFEAYGVLRTAYGCLYHALRNTKHVCATRQNREGVRWCLRNKAARIPSMFDTAVVAFTTYFATIGPIEIAAIFAGLTPDNTASQRRLMALKGTLIAGGILLVFALVGEVVLEGLGITLAAFRAAGGILLLILGIEMVFARSSGGDLHDGG